MSPFKVGTIALTVVVVLALALGSFTVINAQERGVVTRFGSINRVLEDGLHFKTPFVEDVVSMDITIQALAVTEQAYSKDAQTVSAEATVNYSLDPLLVGQVFKEVRRDYERRLVMPAVKDSIKTVLSGYTAQGILDNRALLPSKMKEVLEAELANRGILIANVLITNVDFDDAYEAAVRNKQVQEQEALAQVNVTKQQDEKKKQEILKAEALAQKTLLEVKALQSSQGKQIIEKIYAEAALESAKKWNGVLPTQMYGSAPIPFVTLPQ